MKTLKESLLGNIEDNLVKGDEWAKRINTIGDKLELIKISGTFVNKIAKNVSKTALKKATKNAYMSDELERVSNDYKTFGFDDTAKMFVQWIENYKIESLNDLNDVTNKLNDANKLNHEAINTGIFKQKAIDNLKHLPYVSSPISVWNTGIWAGADYQIEIQLFDCTLNLYYKIRK